MSGNLAKNFELNPNNELFYTLCNTMVNCERRFRVNKHQRSMLYSTTATTKQDVLAAAKKEFKAKLVETFFAADIPLKSCKTLASGSYSPI